MPPIVAYHRITGPHTFPFEADARHAVSRFPGEWSRTPWPAPPVRTDDKPTAPAPDAITSAIEGLADRVTAFRKATAMDRLSAKLEAAAGVVGRVTANLEHRADRVIAREASISKRSEQLFAAKHAILDSADAGLDGIEAKLALLSNDPLESSGPSPTAPSSPSSSEAIRP
jgi:hypothetical protein